jgi:hypothetical protein
MTSSLATAASITDMTNRIAEQINADFYKLKSSFKSLSVYELFIEILKNRGFNYHTEFDIKVHEEIKASILQQLIASLGNKTFTESEMHIETFYLGIICGVLVHGNIPVPSEFEIFGKFESSPSDLKDWRL